MKRITPVNILRVDPILHKKGLDITNRCGNIIIPGPDPTVFTDNFNRANSNVIGPPWEELENIAADIAINNNLLRFSSDTPTGYVRWAKYIESRLQVNQFAEIVLSAASTPAGNQFALTIRRSGGDINTIDAGTGYYARFVSSGNPTQLCKTISGTTTILSMTTTDYRADFGARFKLEIIGTAVKLYRNDVVILSGTGDGTITQVGYSGIIAQSGGAGTTLDFEDWKTGLP